MSLSDDASESRCDIITAKIFLLQEQARFIGNVFPCPSRLLERDTRWTTIGHAKSLPLGKGRRNATARCGLFPSFHRGWNPLPCNIDTRVGNVEGRSPAVVFPSSIDLPQRPQAREGERGLKFSEHLVKISCLRSKSLEERRWSRGNRVSPKEDGRKGLAGAMGGEE